MTRKQFLLSHVTPHAMPAKQMRDLQTHLKVMALAWDGVAREMRKARESVSVSSQRYAPKLDAGAIASEIEKFPARLANGR